jgi:hypothetical protein
MAGPGLMLEVDPLALDRPRTPLEPGVDGAVIFTEHAHEQQL